MFPLIEEFKREFEVTLATATGRLNQSTDEAKALVGSLIRTCIVTLVSNESEHVAVVSAASAGCGGGE